MNLFKTKIAFSAIMLFSILLCNCQSRDKNQNLITTVSTAEKTDNFPVEKPEPPMYTNLAAFQSISIAGHAVDIALPDSGVAYAGNIVVLPGYN